MDDADELMVCIDVNRLIVMSCEEDETRDVLQVSCMIGLGAECLYEMVNILSVQRGRDTRYVMMI